MSRAGAVWPAVTALAAPAEPVRQQAGRMPATPLAPPGGWLERPAPDQVRRRLDVVKLTRHIGAEIRGVDLRARLEAETVRALYQAWLQHAVLVFRGQTLTQEDLTRITGYFGTLGAVRQPVTYQPPAGRLRAGVMMISNIRENGAPIGALADGAMTFHHDMIHAEMPTKATLLYAVEVPGLGGNTLFASGTAAYEALEPALRNRLEGRKALHHYKIGALRRGQDTGAKAFGEAAHPVFRTHEDTRRKAVYVDRLMTTKILGLPAAEGEALLQQVVAHSEKREFLYEHVWRPGDLVLWDNRCSAHARTDFPPAQRRLLLRTSVQGDVRPY